LSKPEFKVGFALLRNFVCEHHKLLSVMGLVFSQREMFIASVTLVVEQV